MRKFAFALALLCATQAWAAGANVQCQIHRTNGSATNTLSAFSSDLTAGNGILVGVVTVIGTTAIATTDTLGQTYTNSAVSTTNNGKVAYSYIASTASGADTVTVTLTGGTFSIAFACEMSGLNAGSFLDGTPIATDQSASTTWTGGSLTTTQPNSWVCMFGGTTNDGRTYTAGSGYVIPTNGQLTSGFESMFVECGTQVAAGAYTPTVALSSTGVIGKTETIAFKASLAAANRAPINF